MKFGTVVLLTLFLTIKCSQLNAQEWKKFVPLSTTRTDVESLLGPGGEGFEVVYQLKDGALSIEYSTGPCTSERKGGMGCSEERQEAI